MDYETEIQQLKAKIASYEQLLRETSAPIIPSLIEDAILVPIAGPTSLNRLDAIRTRVLQYVADHRGVNNVVFDFTGVEVKDISQLDYNSLTIEIGHMNTALKLMGTHPIYVGFNPRLVREIVQAGIHVEIETYANFKTALTVLFHSNGQSFYSS